MEDRVHMAHRALASLHLGVLQALMAAPFDSDVGTATVVNGDRQAGPVRPRAPAARPRVLRPSLREADLLQEILALPEEPLMVHPPVHPVADRRHADREPLARGGNGLPIWRGHSPREGAGHDAGDRRPATGTEAYRVHLDRDVWPPGEKGLQVLDVLLDPPRFVPVRPG